MKYIPMILLVAFSIACSATGRKNDLYNSIATGGFGPKAKLIDVVKRTKDISGAIEVLNDRGEHVKTVTQLGVIGLGELRWVLRGEARRDIYPCLMTARD